MRNKSALLQSIKDLSSETMSETAYITNGHFYWGNGMWLFPEQIQRHKGPLVQFYLNDLPKPAQIRDAKMVPVDTWLEADEIARNEYLKSIDNEEK